MPSKEKPTACARWQRCPLDVPAAGSAAGGLRQRVEISFDLNRETARLAGELGLSPDEVLAEAERILAERSASTRSSAG